MGYKLFEFLVVWVLCLPASLMGESKHLTIRIIGLILTGIWVTLMILPLCIPIMISCIWMLIEGDD